MIVRFRVIGTAAMLSHAEMSRVLQRACARADIPVRYSEGFNPHPRLSLPLPRPVGVESDDELLVARLCEDPTAGSVGDRAESEAAMMRALAEQLPEGIEVLAVTLAGPNASFGPRSAEYVLPVRTDRTAGLTERIAGVMASEHCTIERASGGDKAARSIDVRSFLRSIRLEPGKLIVEHTTGDAGSIRVDEILRLLDLRVEDLAGPIRRGNVVWETTKLQNAVQQPRSDSGAEDIEDGTRDVD
ncbi:MAG: TIGR03936 family radical SAM-associated protein [Phycisphaerales bacterium]